MRRQGGGQGDVMITVSRYVGDMLAWLHQSCPGEAESVHHLLKLCDKVEITG